MFSTREDFNWEKEDFHFNNYFSTESFFLLFSFGCSNKIFILFLDWKPKIENVESENLKNPPTLLTTHHFMTSLLEIQDSAIHHLIFHRENEIKILFLNKW